MIREIKDMVKGYRTSDGAGVSLVRVLGSNTYKNYNPFLMMDSFDSKDPNDYIKGFPMHPHRGIETITYLVEGKMAHRDNIGNEGIIGNGEAQWMTAGSGILHEEMPQPSDRMLGVQVWLNIPKKDKFCKPDYNDIKDLKTYEEDGYNYRIVSGEYKGNKGFEGKYIKATFLDFEIEKDKEILIDTKSEENVYVFLLLGDGVVNGVEVEEKTAISFKEGDQIKVKAKDENLRLLYLSAPYLDEPVAYGGPVVMNTREEVMEAMRELREGTFIKEKVSGGEEL